MNDSTTAWAVDRDAVGASLMAEIQRINALGPFVVDDPIVGQAPRRAWLVDGRFEFMNPPTNYHYWIAGELVRLLNDMLGKRGLSIGPCGVRTKSDRTLREADVVVHLGLRPADLPAESYSRQPPDLVVEVLSPSTKAVDRGEKKDEYEAIGVREYYLLDPKSGAVEAFVLEEGRYVRLERGDAGFTSQILQATWDPASVLNTE